MDLIKSKKRVTDHGEVFTSDKEVNGMLNLVKNETERVDSRFLEPACGNGNFLAEILKRKLRIIKYKYEKNLTEYERNVVTAITSLYGIDLLEDNVVECRTRLFGIVAEEYQVCFKKQIDNDLALSLKYILDKNIICGNALTLQSKDNIRPIIFSEWTAVNSLLVKRRDFTLVELLNFASPSNSEPTLFSDLNYEVFIPTPIKEYELKHFRRLFDYA